VSGWRNWALIVGTLVTVGGVLMWRAGAGPMFLIAGVLTLVTAAVEPIYGRANGKPDGKNWRETDERFVDPDSGKLVTVWFDADTGERRYVEHSEAAPPAA
jgi:hypothetical protein